MDKWEAIAACVFFVCLAAVIIVGMTTGVIK